MYGNPSPDGVIVNFNGSSSDYLHHARFPESNALDIVSPTSLNSKVFCWGFLSITGTVSTSIIGSFSYYSYEFDPLDEHLAAGGFYEFEAALWVPLLSFYYFPTSLLLDYGAILKDALCFLFKDIEERFLRPAPLFSLLLIVVEAYVFILGAFCSKSSFCYCWIYSSVLVSLSFSCM